LLQENEREELRAYANYLGRVLQSQISYLDNPAKGSIKRISQETNENDLVIFGDPRQSLLKQLLAGHPCHKAINQAPVSFLISWRPCWPIRTILLIARVEESDEAAVDWVGRLARPSGAKVVILPLLSSFPSLVAPVGNEETALGELLSPTTEPGQQLRCLSQRLARWQIEGTLRIHQGKPEWQIRREITAGNYDLIVIGAEPGDCWHRLLMDELVNQMFIWLDRPLLLAQPVQAAQSSPRDKSHD
jgi:nucleotide-binding universal stress UspA family protein